MCDPGHVWTVSSDGPATEDSRIKDVVLGAAVLVVHALLQLGRLLRPHQFVPSALSAKLAPAATHAVICSSLSPTTARNTAASRSAASSGLLPVRSHPLNSTLLRSAAAKFAREKSQP